jgi:hypothetical protein
MIRVAGYTKCLSIWTPLFCCYADYYNLAFTLSVIILNLIALTFAQDQ